MRDISFEDCVEFQDCFLFDSHFSPFENVKNFRTYYPRVLIGEIGGLFNLCGKQCRSANIYDEEIMDECAAIFIYLLLFGRMLELHDGRNVLRLIQKHWNDRVPWSLTEEGFYQKCRDLLKKVDSFLDPDAAFLYDESHFYNIFISIQQVSRYITKLEWWEIINRFHKQVIYQHTDINNYTIDGLYRGCFRIHIDRLLCFVDKVRIELPEKRIYFLRRASRIQARIQTLPTSDKNAHRIGRVESRHTPTICSAHGEAEIIYLESS